MPQENRPTFAWRLDQLEARAAVGQLMADYGFGFDNRDAGRFMRIWADDALLYLGERFGERRGLEAIRNAFDAVLDTCHETRHWVTDITVDFTGEDTATGGAHAICFMVNAMGEIFVAADYENEYARANGRWLISSSRVITHWNKKVDLETLP
ncbi:MAG TPA: nuclear transport factor 2 family protein [Solirubrobacteraceae bacterium]|jgi:uncharacterized protein (TIGR02246 family)|nr:nuclear transport factor 2 family protein [Solirubrobacteraceae bacterium]